MSGNSDPTDIQDDLQWIQIKEESEKSFMGKFKKKTMSNPLVPIGVVATTGILCSGIYNLVKRDQVKQQKLMRYRVLAQGLTLLTAVTGILLSAAFK